MLQKQAGTPALLERAFGWHDSLPSSLRTLRAAQGVSGLIFVELSVQGTATRYDLFPDFNPRDDFSFSVLIRTVVKIFRLEVSELGWAFLWFSFKHRFLVPVQWKRWVALALGDLLSDWAS